MIADLDHELRPSRAVTVLVLGVASLLLPILGPFAWWLAGRERRRIDAGLAPASARRLVVYGRAIAIVATVQLVAFAIWLPLFLSGVLPL